MKNLFIGIIFFIALESKGQYAPAAQQPGSTAIWQDSSIIKAWATGCNVQRGFQNIADTSLGLASAGDSSLALAKAGNGVVSLGDGGSAILSFKNPIGNGPGWDFAVFENAFDDFFLELAFVEVSSDGKNFYRFPASFAGTNLKQTATFDSSDARQINMLAGKYRGGFGTPFDLEELKNIAGLNINAISHVKIIDVVGSLNASYAQHDSQGNIVNDPWPTPFPSSGFDLDAVAVINEANVLDVQIFPNPVEQGQALYFSAEADFQLFNNQGALLKSERALFLATDSMQPGLYFLQFNKAAKAYKLLVN